jgi:hypothetical protein
LNRGGGCTGSHRPLRPRDHSQRHEPAWAQELRDFQAALSFGVALGGSYVCAGIVVICSVTALGLSYLTYPLTAGAALLRRSD